MQTLAEKKTVEQT